jgi:hypothetical protein
VQRAGACTHAWQVPWSFLHTAAVTVTVAAHTLCLCSHGCCITARVSAGCLARWAFSPPRSGTKVCAAYRPRGGAGGPHHVVTPSGPLDWNFQSCVGRTSVHPKVQGWGQGATCAHPGGMGWGAAWSALSGRTGNCACTKMHEATTPPACAMPRGWDAAVGMGQ